MTTGFGKPELWTRKSFMVIAATVLACCLPATAGCGHQGAQGGPTATASVAPMAVLEMQRSQSEGTAAIGSASIVGFWHVLFTSGGQPFDEGYDVWHSDGTEILNDNAPPTSANGGGNFCMGAYEKSGPGAYRLNRSSRTLQTVFC